jgi:predicted MFS family arabinose efflux permease
MLGAMRAIRQLLRGTPIEDPCLLLYPLVTACVAADVAFVPLLPGIRASEGLSSLQAGVLLAAGPAVMSFAPVPLGRLADRLGAAAVLRAAGICAVAASATLAATRGFPGALFARALIGLVGAAIWTAGPAVAASRRASVARLLAASGAGLLLGPLIAGVIGQSHGPPAAFIAAGALAAIATVAFWRAEIPPVAGATGAGAGGAAGLRLAIGDPRVRVGALGLLMLGLTKSISDLLGPAQLHADGMTSSHVGLVVTVAGAIGLCTATLARRLVDRYPTTSLACFATLALATIWLIPVAIQGMLGISCFLAAGACGRMLLNPASYVLVGEGAVATGSGTAVTVGASNAIFGVAGMIGPLVGAVVLPHPELGFVAIALLCLAAAGLMRSHATQQLAV